MNAESTTTATDARERLRDGMNRYAVKHGEFTLASGAKSNFYFNGKEVTLRGEYLRLVAELMWPLMAPLKLDAVGGMSLGGDPIVSAVTMVAAEQGVDCPALIIRKEAKGHGTQRQIEGPYTKGMRVAVVEDVTTTGGSAKRAADAIIAAGGTVVGVFTIMNREAGADQLFAELGWPFYSLFGMADFKV
jgi:orotate phosphoribosyltransferase